MKRKPTRTEGRVDRRRHEYDFSVRVRGKHAAQYASGTNAVVLEPDVASESRESRRSARMDLVKIRVIRG